MYCITPSLAQEVLSIFYKFKLFKFLSYEPKDIIVELWGHCKLYAVNLINMHLLETLGNEKLESISRWSYTECLNLRKS